MTTYGVTSTGFVRKHLPDVVADLQQAFKDAFGADIPLDAKSVFGKLVGCFSQPLAEAWELAEHVYNAFYPSGSADNALDGCLDLIGLSRLAATHSTVDEMVGGTPGTVIPAGSRVATTTDGTLFETLETVTLSSAVAVECVVGFTEPVQEGHTYGVIINGHSFIHEATAGEDEIDVAAAIIALLTASTDPLLLASGYGTNQIRITAVWFIPFSLTPDSTMSVDLVTNITEMQSVEAGPIHAYALKLTEIRSPVSGWTIATNAADASLGRLVEIDSEARQRRASSLAFPGASTVGAVLAKVGQVEGVTNVSVFHNVTDVTDGDGFLPHSIAVVVRGGDDEAIAEKIWDCVGGGDATNGTTTVLVRDSQGYQHGISFYRPDELEFWVRVTYWPYDEESFPTSATDLIKAAVVTAGSALQPGQDVLPQRFMGPIFAGCGGIGRMTVEVAEDDGGSPGTYQSTPYAVGKLEWARFAAGRVQVVAGT